jgi:uncharacterized Ntn-hydrolase superfamily protein
VKAPEAYEVMAYRTQNDYDNRNYSVDDWVNSKEDAIFEAKELLAQYEIAVVQSADREFIKTFKIVEV